MNVLPVISRELRSEARHEFTYWLRVIGAGVVILAACVFVLLRGFRASEGALLFQQLHAALHLSVWLLVPLLTADCLSRERREGTLGLLFLTPLKALDIVIAKSAAHALRAFTLLLAVVPVITLPLLMGGVTWQQATGSLLTNGAALALALAAGLLGSALSRTWTRALILAFLFNLFFGGLFLFLLSNLFVAVANLRFGGDLPWLRIGFSLATTLNPDASIGYYYYSPYAAWRMRGLPPASGTQATLLTAAHALWICWGTLGVAGLIAAWLTKRSWQERPAGPLQLWLKRRFCTPLLALDILKGWMARSLDRNPIGWLERRTWSGRLVIWGWLAAMISIYSSILSHPNYLTRSFTEVHVFMGWVLLASMALNASTSLRRERETRVLELLLVSPLNEHAIITGRLRGLWGQFLPTIAVLLGGWIYLSLQLNRAEDNLGFILFLGAAFVVVPIIGLYFSLVCRNFLTALTLTALVGIILPLVFREIVTLLLRVGFLPGQGTLPFEAVWRLTSYMLHPVVIFAVLGISFWRRLHRRLVQRRFATETS